MTQETISIISSLIASLAAIAALVTAVATILTVRQIRQQREASYRPELAFSETRVYGYASDSSGGIPNKWSETEIADYKQSGTTMEISTSSYDLRLYNIGFGAAKNTEVSWDFPVSPYPARAGCATAAGSRRTRWAPPGRVPVFS